MVSDSGTEDNAKAFKKSGVTRIFLHELTYTRQDLAFGMFSPKTIIIRKSLLRNISIRNKHAEAYLRPKFILPVRIAEYTG